MFIKIFFDDKPLFLCNDVDASLQPYVHHDDAVFIDELDIHAVKSMIHEMQQPQVHAGIYFHKKLEELKKAFFKKFTPINAAGGFVKNEKDEALMIFRRGKWDLPKGNLNKKESAEVCAIRATEEATGLKNVKLISPLLTTWHTYHEGSRFILKETKWFSMKVTSKQQLVPQVEEDISQIAWVPKSGLDKYLQNSYPLVVDVLNTGFSQSG